MLYNLSNITQQENAHLLSGSEAHDQKREWESQKKS